MPTFIEVARLESCQKSGEIWLEGERRRNEASLPIWAKILSPIRTEVFKISTRSKRHSIPYPPLCIYTQFQEVGMNEMVSKKTLKTVELQY